MADDRLTPGQGCGVATVAGVILVGVVALGAWGCPQYTVYSQRMAGEAKLAESEASRQVIVSEARARKEAAEMEAEAIRTVGKALEDNPKYLTRYWIEKVNENGNSVIYIPTEAGLPILEAGRTIDTHPVAPKK